MNSTSQSKDHKPEGMIQGQPTRRMVLFSEIWRRREVAVLILIALLTVFMVLTNENFTKPANLRAITDPVASDMLITIAVTLILISGGIDVSVGSVLGLSALTAANILSSGGAIWVAILAAIAVGALVGAVNGFFISIINLNPLVTTLGTMVAVRGISVAWTKGYLIGDLPEEFGFLGQGTIGPVGVPITIAVVFAAVFYILLNYTPFMRQLYFMGGNKEAARLLGVRVRRVQFAAYTISGTLAAVAGVIVLSRTMVGASQLGTGAEFRAIPAAVIGGASLMGGEGNLLGPMLAVLLLAMINDALILFGVSSYYQGLAQGAILLLAVTVDAVLHRRRLAAA